MYALRLLPFLSLLTLLLAPLQANAEDPFKPFYGEYSGQAVTSVGEVEKRELDVSISPLRRGFTLGWSTTVHRASGKIKQAKFSIDFKSTQRDGVFSSGMRNGKFGNKIPLDPLNGDPFVWATVSGKTLVVNSLLVLEDGGYEMQTYKRTLTATGLDLQFSRVRNGKNLKLIEGMLTRK